MKLTKEIFNLLKEQNSIVNDFRNSGNSWIGDFTMLIKQTIVDLGVDKYDYYVSCYDINNASQNEWLFDISYAKVNWNGSKTTTLSFPLIVESELTKITFGGFKEDFDKLFIATSSERLFIFRKLNQNLFNEIMEYAQLCVNNYKPFTSGEGIDLIYWDEIGTKDFQFLEVLKE